MSTALPPSDGDRPTEGESAATPATSKAARPASRASGGTGAARSSSRARTAKSTDASEPTTAEGAAAKGAAAKGTTAKGAAASSAGTKGAAASGSAASGSAAAGAAAAKKPATRTRRTTAKPAPIAPEGEAPSIMDATLGARNPVATGATAGSGAADTSSSPSEPLAESEATTKRLPTAEEVYAAPASSASAARPADTTLETTDVPEPESTTGERSATAATPTAVAPTKPEGATAVGERLGSTASTERLGAIDADAAPSHADVASTAPATADAATAAAATVDAATVDAAAVDSTTADSTTAPGAGPAVGGYARAEAPEGALPADAAGPHAPSGRTVSDLADRLDDSRFFSSLFDFTFTNYVTRKLAGPVYVVGLVLIALGVVVGFANSLTSAIATHAPIGAFVFLFGVLITLVGAMLAVLLLRVGIEVFCAIIEIAQNTRRRRPPGE